MGMDTCKMDKKYNTLACGQDPPTHGKHGCTKRKVLVIVVVTIAVLCCLCCVGRYFWTRQSDPMDIVVTAQGSELHRGAELKEVVVTSKDTIKEGATEAELVPIAMGHVNIGHGGLVPLPPKDENSTPVVIASSEPMAPPYTESAQTQL